MAVRSRYLSFVSRLAAILGCAATAPALAQGVAVQWKTSAGGNGHWYLFRPVATPIDWQQARASAESLGGHLATPTSAAENAFILGSVIAQGVAENDYGPHIGGFRDPKIPEPSAACANWHWTTGEPFDFLPDYGYDLCQSWANSVIEETRLHYWYGHTMIWNNCFGSLVSKYQLIEWSADCNNDGIVDFGQILSGEFQDANRNGIPDRVCECLGDLDADGAITGADLGQLLAAWGAASPGATADLNADGSIDGFDLAYLLAGWGPCSD